MELSFVSYLVGVIHLFHFIQITNLSLSALMNESVYFSSKGYFTVSFEKVLAGPGEILPGET